MRNRDFSILNFAGGLLVFMIVVQSCVQEAPFFDGDLEMLKTPSVEGGESNLFVSETSGVYLSWIEYVNDSTDALMFSMLDEGRSWSSAREIARGSNWFVNWADFPSLVVYGEEDELMAAHWLQKSDVGTFDYDVRISLSSDGGRTWSDSFVPHRDGVAAEHGFVSLLPVKNDDVMAVWLDGRNTAGDVPDDGGHGHHGEMTLRTAMISPGGEVSHDRELDPRICDCCQTSAVTNGDDIVVAYRDRSIDEIRDISVVRMEDGWWHDPVPVSNDGWRIAGCPVNGPSLASYGEDVALAWYTMADDTAQVYVAFSEDGGRTFGERVQVDDGKPIGRVDVVMIGKDEVMVSWMEETGDGEGELRIKQLNSNAITDNSKTITTLNSARQSGFPRMVYANEHLIFSWTDADRQGSVVRTATLTLK